MSAISLIFTYIFTCIQYLQAEKHKVAAVVAAGGINRQPSGGVGGISRQASQPFSLDRGLKQRVKDAFPNLCAASWTYLMVSEAALYCIYCLLDIWTDFLHFRHSI